MAAYMSSWTAAACTVAPDRRIVDFGCVPQLLDRQRALHVDDAVAVPQDARDLLLDVAPQRRRDLDVVSAQVDLHRPVLL